MLLASRNPLPLYHIVVCSVAIYKPHLSNFWPRIFLFLNLCFMPDFSYPRNPENVRHHSSSSTKNVTPLYSIQLWKCDPIQRHIPSSLLLRSPPPGVPMQSVFPISSFPSHLSVYVNILTYWLIKPEQYEAGVGASWRGAATARPPPSPSTKLLENMASKTLEQAFHSKICYSLSDVQS